MIEGLRRVKTGILLFPHAAPMSLLGAPITSEALCLGGPILLRPVSITREFDSGAGGSRTISRRINFEVSGKIENREKGIPMVPMNYVPN